MQSTRRRRATVYSAFLVFGVITGTTYTGYSELKRHFDITDAHLGLVLTIAAIVSLPVQFFGGVLIQHFERRLFVAVNLGRATAFLALVALTGDPRLLPLVMAASAVCGGLYNVVINAGMLHHEHDRKDLIAASAHACFSFGAVLGTIVTGLLLHFGAGFVGVYLAAAALCLVALSTKGVANGLAGDPSTERRRIDWSLLRRYPVVLLCLTTTVGCVGEVAMYVWPAIYLRDELGSGALIGALGGTGFFAAMALGRFLIAPAQRRFGRTTLLVFSGAAVTTGMTIALSTERIPVVLVGFAVTGIAFAAVVPIGYSLSGAVSKGRASAVAALVAASGSAGTLVAPSIIGSISGFSSLRWGLAVVLVSGVLVTVGGLAFARTSEAKTLPDR